MGAFSWEKKFKRTWEELDQVSSNSDMISDVSSFDPYFRSLIRNFHIIIDFSLQIEEKDFLPTIRYNLCSTLVGFIRRYKEQNSFSVLTVHKLCGEEYTSMEINEEKELKEFMHDSGKGVFNVNGVVKIMDAVGTVFCTDYLLICNSIHTEEKIRKLPGSPLNVVSIRGDLRFLRDICKYVGGEFIVPKGIDLLEINRFLTPVPVNAKSLVSLLPLVFPEPKKGNVVCSCHLEVVEASYECRCGLKICKLPASCKICGLYLVSSIQMHKMMFFYFPMKKFTPLKKEDNFNASSDKSQDFSKCAVCFNTSYSSCPSCNTVVCYSCDKFMHENINFCFFCE